jgi:hypothetical protein
MWLKSGKKLQIESKKSGFINNNNNDDDNNNNNNNNNNYLSVPWILDTSSLKETGPRFCNKDPS